MPFVFNEEKTMNIFTSCCLCAFITLCSWGSVASAQIVEIPDPNLRQAIRETPTTVQMSVPITEQEMLRLKTGFAAERCGRSKISPA